MSFTLLSTPILLLFFTVAFIEIYNGAKKGFLRSAVSLGLDVSALFLSFFATAACSRALAAVIVKETAEMRLSVDFAARVPSFFSVLSDFLTMLIGTVLYVFVFLLLRVAVREAAREIYRRRMAKRGADAEEEASDTDGASRAKGAFCGFLSAVLLTCTLTAPVTGSLLIAEPALAIAGYADDSEDAQTVRVLNGDPVSKLFYRIGGRVIYDNAGSVYASGEKVLLLSEARALASVSGDLTLAYAAFHDPLNAGEEHAQSLRRLGTEMWKSALCAPLWEELVRGCADAWRRGEAFPEIGGPAVHSIMNPVFRGVLEACAEADAEGLSRNTATMLEVYALILESGIAQGDCGTILTNLSESGVIGKMNAVLAENPDTAHLDATDFALSAIASFFLRTSACYELTPEIASAVALVNSSEEGAEEKEAQLASLLQAALEKQGFTVTSDFAVFAARQILKEFPGANVDGNDVIRLFQKYDMSVR
ncbi:MAG: hypothetical protein IJD59_03920 [Clostridia bacterium]|nr:hypothetical protein [Clostridia bacterium]